MPDFPKINDKFYQAGKRAPSLRAAVEQAANLTPPDDAPGAAFDRDAWRDRESKTFSLFIGFIDGTLERLRR